MYQHTSCKSTASIMTNNNELIYDNAEHNHSAEAHDEPMRKFKIQLKNESEASSSSSRDIFDNISRNHPNEVSSRISYPMVARGMLLRKHHRYPMIPETASMFVEALMENE